MSFKGITKTNETLAWSQNHDDVEIMTGELDNVTIAATDTVYVRTDTTPYKIYKVSQGVESDLYGKSDFATKRFPILYKGVNEIIVTGASEITVEGRYYMKPYEIEIFDRQFNFIFNALIDEEDFVYNYDSLSPQKNKISISKDFTPEKLSNESNAPKGWFIRIFRDDEEYQGVISGFEAGNNQNAITYSQLISIFNTEDTLKRSTLMVGTSIEQNIKGEITSNFVSNQDTLQNITGLYAANINVTTMTSGLLPYQKTDEEYIVVNVVNDLIIPAETVYGIHTEVSIDFGTKTISVTIGKVSTTAKTIEADLSNVITKNITIKKSNEAVNRADIYDNYLNIHYTYYLHPDGSYSTTNTNRITPVEDEDATFSSYQEAYQAVNQTYVEYEDKIRRLFQDANTMYRELGSDNYQSFIRELQSLWETYGTSKSKHFSFVVAEKTAGTWKQVVREDGAEIDVIEPPAEYESFDYTDGQSENFTVSGEWFNDNHPAGGYFDWYVEGVAPEDADLSYIYLDYPDFRYSTGSFYPYYPYILDPGGFGSPVRKYANQGRPPLYEAVTTPILVTAHIIIKQTNGFGVYEFNIGAAADASWFIDALNEKKVQEINVNIENYARTASPIAAAALADEIFAKNKYTNLIELTVKKDDSMINPLDMQIGQIVNIIRDGVSYSSILTGKEISKGIVKLIFGTIRLDLTKILNMKGV